MKVWLVVKWGVQALWCLCFHVGARVKTKNFLACRQCGSVWSLKTKKEEQWQ